MTQLPIDAYLKHIKSYPEPKVKFPKIGKIYIFGYLFNQDRTFNNLENTEEIKFYDLIPATFIWNIDIKNYLFNGFNLHKIPVIHRERWIEILYKFSDDIPDPKKFLVLKRLFQTAGFAMRTYDMKKTRKLREVPRNRWNELMEFDSNTTLKATSAEITAKYLSLIE